MSYARIFECFNFALGFITLIVVGGAGLFFLWPGENVSADEIGKVDTKFRFLTPDDTVRIEVFDDPDVAGVACYLSRARTGGVKGAIGVAEDTSDASIDCRQVGQIEFKGKLKDGEKVFSERRSLIFKELQVVRYCDDERNALVYLVYSDRVIEGSPKNSVSAVPIYSKHKEGPAPRCKKHVD
jgi:CreA protein